MTRQELDSLPVPQRSAVLRLQERSGYELDEFLIKCSAPCGTLAPYVGVEGFHGMFVGIEPDGYTHT